jgi:hypothetical protein
LKALLRAGHAQIVDLAARHQGACSIHHPGRVKNLFATVDMMQTDEIML